MPLWAQSGTLTVSTFDSNHRFIPGAKVYLQAVGQKQMLTGQTDAKGVYSFQVTVGKYIIRAEKEAELATMSEIIKVGTSTKLNLTLQPQYFDEPHFAVSGVTDNTYRGGHGADTLLRSSEELSRATAELSRQQNDIGAENERAGHPLAAVREYQRAAHLDPTEANLFEWGTELLIHRAHQEAAEVFRKGVRLFPRSTRMILALASAYYAAGAYDLAADCFFQATDLNPAELEPYLFLSRVQAKEILDSDGYRERISRFAKLHPDSAMANYLDGLSLWNQGNSKEAQLTIEKAILLDPKFGPAYLQLGIIHAYSKNYSEAIAAYQRAIAVDSQMEEAHYRLSEAYRISGDYARARLELLTYQRLSKTSAEKLERERRELKQFVISLKSQ